MARSAFVGTVRVVSRRGALYECFEPIDNRAPRRHPEPVEIVPKGRLVGFPQPAESRRSRVIYRAVPKGVGSETGRA
jgi:hypothetical protein